MALRSLLRGGVVLGTGVWLSAASAAAPLSTAVPPSPGLVRSLAAFERDLLELDGALRPRHAPAPAPLSLADPALQPPDPQAAPATAAAADQPQERVLSLAQALSVAVANNPELAERRARIAEMRGLQRSVQGRFWPRLALNLGGSFAQRSDYNLATEGNSTAYKVGSPFLVETGGWQRIQANLAEAWGGWGSTGN